MRSILRIHIFELTQRDRTMTVLRRFLSEVQYLTGRGDNELRISNLTIRRQSQSQGFVRVVSRASHALSKSLSTITKPRVSAMRPSANGSESWKGYLMNPA